MRVFVNGRFLTQPMSGVQRFAYEILTALDDSLAATPDRLGPVEVLVPQPVPDPAWRVLRTRVVRGGRGHVWEQGALARAARDGCLVSLGNSGPLRHACHVLCLHDAHIFDMPEAFDAAYRTLHRTLRPALARRARALITVSRHSARALSQHLRVPRERFDIIPNSAEHVLRLPHDPGAPARYGLTPGGYLLCVGNQSPNKNIAALAAAHARAADRLPPLALVGGAVPGVALAQTGHGLGRVPDADLRGLYEGAAAFVFPSLNEGFGIPPLEAMQLGVPVICARAGAMPEVLGTAPIWFDPRDTADITRALRAFAALSPAARTEMRVMGRAVAQAYRWRNSAEDLLAVIDRVSRARHAA
ncbi:MAG: glycosyltransferase family 1 protein [Pseudomonadota bacterium]